MAGDTIGRPKLELEVDRTKLKPGFDAAVKESTEGGKRMGEGVAKGFRDSKASERAFDSLQRRIKSIQQDLSGNKATGRLNELAMAVQKMGGAAKLTDVNLERLRNQIKGLQAQGGKAPKALQALIPAPGRVEPTTKALDNLKASLASTSPRLGGFGQALTALGPAGLAAAAAVAVSTAAIGKLIATLAEWSREAIETSTSLSELSLETGMSAEAVQEWIYAGTKVGVQAPQVSKAIGDTSRRIAEGSTNTRKAIEALGLSFEDVRRMKPEKQFETIMRALKGVADEGEQSAIKTALMSEEMSILRLVRSDFDALRQEAHEYGAVIDGEVLKANDELGRELHALDQSWRTFKTSLVAGITTSPQAAQAIDDIAKALGRLTAKVMESLPEIQSYVNALVSMIRVSAAYVAGGGGAAGGIAAGAEWDRLKRQAEEDARRRREGGGTGAGGGSGPGAGGGGRPRFDPTGDAAAAQAASAAAAAAAKLRDIRRQIDEERLRGLPNLEKEIAKIDLGTQTQIAAADAELKAKKISKDAHKARVDALRILGEEKKETARLAQAKKDEAEAERKAKADATKATQEKAKADAEARRILELLGTSHQQAVADYQDLNAAVEANGGLTNLSREQLEQYLRRLEQLKGHDIPGLYADMARGQAELATRTKTAAERAEEQRKKVEQLRDTIATLNSVVGQLSSALQQAGVDGAETFAKLADSATSAAMAIASGNIAATIGSAFSFGYNLAESAFGETDEEVILRQAREMGLDASEQFLLGLGTGRGQGADLWREYMLHIVERAKDQGQALSDLAQDFPAFFNEAWKQGDVDLIRDFFRELEDEVGRGVPGALEAMGDATDQVFQQMRTGQMSAATGTEILGDAISSLGEAAESGVVGARDELRGLIREAKEAGLKIPEITELIRDGLSQATEGLGKLPPIVTQQDAKDQAQLFATTWQATVQELGVGGAVAQLGDAYTRLKEQAQAGGFDISGILGPEISQIMEAARPEAAIAQLDKDLKAGRISQKERDTQVAALESRAATVQGIDALQNVAAGFEKADILDPKAFEALQRQTVSQYERLVAGGMSEDAAQELIGPLLGKLAGQAEDFGLDLAPQLQDLLGESGLALRNDKTAEMADTIKDQVAPALWQLVELQGGVAPALEDVGKSIQAIRTGGAGPAGPYVQIPDMRELGTGGVVMSRTATILGERGPEAVMPLDRLGGLLGDEVPMLLREVIAAIEAKAFEATTVIGGHEFKSVVADAINEPGEAHSAVGNAQEGRYG